MRLFFLDRPKVVIGFGGFPCFVPMICSWCLRVPRFLQEQNGRVGLANKLLSVIANQIFSVHGARGFLSKSSVKYIENPVREEFQNIARWEAPRDNSIVLLVLGGSQGASGVNNLLLESVSLLKKYNVRLIHQTGERDFSRVSSEYEKQGYTQARVGAFFDDVAGLLAESHLVISRAGAMAIAEITASRRPAIYIPFPGAGAHQEDNLLHVLSRKAGILFKEGQGTEGELEICWRVYWSLERD